MLLDNGESGAPCGTPTVVGTTCPWSLTPTLSVCLISFSILPSAIRLVISTKLVNFLRRKHKRRGRGFRDCLASFLQKAGLYQLHGTLVRVSLMPPGEHGRKAG